MTDIRILLRILGDESAVEEYWENLSHISPNSSESEISVLIDDITVRVAKKACRESDVVVKVMPSDNTEESIAPSGQYNVQWVELERKVKIVGDSELNIAVKAEAPEGILALVWAEDTWIPVLEHLKERGLINPERLEAFYNVTEGMYWG
tara:strand:+ start:752 stop:1201 length:450 start_codon:yes stop_codon:yes gene_type:complete